MDWGASSSSEKKLASIARVKELWRQKAGRALGDKKAWTIFISSGRSFEELFIDVSSSDEDDDSDRDDTWYWDPAWMKDENEERNRVKWEREEKRREVEWQRKQQARKQAEKQAFLLWSSRWDERNLALQSIRAGSRGRRNRKQGVASTPRNGVGLSSRETSSEAEPASIRKAVSELSYMSDQHAEKEDDGVGDLVSDDDEEADSEEDRKEREWAQEVSSAEQRMERGQEAAARTHKRRREAFFENRRSTSDLSSFEFDSTNELSSSNESTMEDTQGGGAEQLDASNETDLAQSGEGLDSHAVTIKPHHQARLASSASYPPPQGAKAQPEVGTTSKSETKPQERRKKLGSIRLLASWGKQRRPTESASAAPGEAGGEAKKAPRLRRVLSSEALPLKAEWSSSGPSS